MTAQFSSAFVKISRQHLALVSVDCIRYDADLVKDCADSTESTRNQAMLDDLLGSHFPAALTHDSRANLARSSVACSIEPLSQ